MKCYSVEKKFQIYDVGGVKQFFIEFARVLWYKAVLCFLRALELRRHHGETKSFIAFKVLFGFWSGQRWFCSVTRYGGEKGFTADEWNVENEKTSLDLDM